MKFTMFKTPKPKNFSYRPRYYDKAKEERERRKAELGYESKLDHGENLRAMISQRWRKGDKEESGSRFKVASYLVMATIIVGSIYVIFLTDFVDKLVALFGVGK